MSVNSSARLLQLVKQAEMQQKQADFLSLMRSLGRMTGQAGRAVGEKFNLGKAFFDKYRPNNVSSADWMKNKARSEASMRAQGGTMPFNRFKDKNINPNLKPKVQNQNANIALSGLGGLGAGTALAYGTSPSSTNFSDRINTFNQQIPELLHQAQMADPRFASPTAINNLINGRPIYSREGNPHAQLIAGDGFSSFFKKSNFEKNAGLLSLLASLAAGGAKGIYKGTRFAAKKAPVTTGLAYGGGLGYGMGRYQGSQENKSTEQAAQKYINNLIERNNANVDKMVKYEPLPKNWSSNSAPPKEMKGALPPAAKSKGLIESLFGR